MGYAQDTGYIPATINDLMLYVMEKINEQFSTSYTAETFEGTGFYKFFYAQAQRMQANEVKTSEIFLKLQDYFNETNETILNPKTTPEGLIQTFLEAGYTASVKPMEVADAGKQHICVDVDDAAEDYAETKLEIATIIKDNTSGGVVCVGTEEQDVVISNGQTFTYKYNLPTRIEVLLKLTLTISRNNKSVIEADDDIKQTLLDNIAAKYALGKDFEPETYFTIADAPWCSDILLEYSVDDGETYTSVVYESDYDELFEFSLLNTTLIQS